MDQVATVIETPVGPFPAPMHPLWPQKLAACETKEDLFELVRQDGFVCPDALAEVQARNWYGDYVEWRREQCQAR